MPNTDLRFFNPKGPDRVAVVSVEPTYGRDDSFLIRLARGPKTGKLSKGATYGPYAQSALDAPYAQVINAIYAEGFLPAGMHGAMESFFSNSVQRRGRAAIRLGWQGAMWGPSVIDALLAALPKAVDEACPIIDALGMLGDTRAIALIRPYSMRKLLSRRRSAVEAMRNLGDGEGLALARERTLDELPQVVREALAPIEAVPPSPQGIANVVAAAKLGEAQRLGLVADLLYERATPIAIAAATQLIASLPFDRPFNWRYIKSVLKRSMLRADFRTFGWLMHEIEARGRVTIGMMAQVKSGYDGEQRPTRIFGRRTQNYLRRSAWRYLRRLAKFRPHAYSAAAAEAIIHYSPNDAQQPVKKYGAFASSYLLHRILWGGGPRFEFVGPSMKFRFVTSKQVAQSAGREEAFSALWDANPAAYIRLLAAAKLVDVQQFAVAGFNRHPELLPTISTDDLIGMLDAPFEPTVNLALGEIGRRFDPRNPDWPLIDRLACDLRPNVSALGQRFLRENISLWSRDVDRVVMLLTCPNATTRGMAADLIIPALRADDLIHQPLALRLLALLRTPEPTPGLYESLARVCREALAPALSSLLSTDEILTLITHGSPSAQAVAGDLLGRRPEALGALGLERIISLAMHPMAAVRSAAQGLIRAAHEYWTVDPSVLFVLIESDWPDTRAAALELIHSRLDFVKMGASVILNLLDSNRIDVQNMGIDLAREHFDHLDPGELVDRLLEHPHGNMRRFALELTTKHLADGAPALAKVERFCRTALLDLWPSRRDKDTVITFLETRGLRDEAQAKIAARLLNEILHVQGRADFERAMTSLVRIKLSYPQVETNLTLPAELVGGEA